MIFKFLYNVITINWSLSIYPSYLKLQHGVKQSTKKKIKWIDIKKVFTDIKKIWLFSKNRKWSATCINFEEKNNTFNKNILIDKSITIIKAVS